MLLLDLGIS